MLESSESKFSDAGDETSEQEEIELKNNLIF